MWAGAKITKHVQLYKLKSELHTVDFSLSTQVLDWRKLLAAITMVHIMIYEVFRMLWRKEPEALVLVGRSELLQKHLTCNYCLNQCYKYHFMNIIFHTFLVYISEVLCFSKSKNNKSMRKMPYNLYCVFWLMLGWNCMREVDEKQEIFLLWPYHRVYTAGETHHYYFDASLK